MTASVGDFVTAVLLAELAADDELVSIEETSRRNNMLREIFKRRRETRQLVWAQVSQMFQPASKKPKNNTGQTQQQQEGQKTTKDVVMESSLVTTTSKKPKKKKKKATVTKTVKKEKISEPDSTESVPAPFLTLSEFSEFQSYFGIKQPAFEKIVLGGTQQQSENENKS